MTDDQPDTQVQEPEATPQTGGEDDELAGLDDHARRMVERANSQAAAFRHELRSAQQAYERLQRQHESEQERAIREAEERGRQAAQADTNRIVAEYERRLATAAIRARAAGGFADPDDAVRMLDLDQLLAERDERRREQQVDKALAALLEAKPYLARERERAGVLISQGGRSQPPDGRPRERSWLRG